MLKSVVLVALVVLFVPLSFGAPEEAFSFEDALKRLGHDDFKERVAAQQELREWSKGRGEEGIAVFYRLYRTHDDPEIRLRTRELLKELVVLSLASEGEGYIGVRMLDQAIVKPGGRPRNAVQITQVMPGTPAERAKLQAGDLVTGIDELDFGQATATEAFADYVRSKKPQETVTLHLLRQGKPMKQKVELMKRPPLDERLFFPLGEEFVPPDHESVEEDEFREWLKKKTAEDAATSKERPVVPRN